MPYTHCPSCRLSTFTAARYATRDACPRCGTELAAEPRSLFRSAAREPGFAAHISELNARIKGERGPARGRRPAT